MYRSWIQTNIRSVAVLAIAVSLLTTGCVATKYPEISSSSDAGSDQYDYIIGAGDTLDIFVWGYEDLSVSVPVRPDGKITTRLVEDLTASGKTPTQLARDIEKRYESYVKRPVVTVTVNKFVGTTNQQIKVVGAGFQPRTVPYAQNMTLLDLMISIGGIGEFSNGNRSVLIRTVGTERMTYGVRLEDLLSKGDVTADFKLRPGDIVMVPQSWF